MKKSLIAIAVITAASTANAIELFNEDRVSVNLGGSIEVFYGNSFDDSALVQQLGDADFSFDTRYAVNDTFSVGGFWEFDGLNDASLGDAYVGLYSNNYGSLVFGKTATALDEMGVGADYQFGISSAVEAIDFGGYEVARYELDTGTVYGAVGLMLNKSGNNDFANEDGSLIDGYIGTRFNGFDIVAFAGQEDLEDSDNKSTIYAIEGRYALSQLNLEAGYYNVSDKEKTLGGDTLAFAADYSVDAWSFAGGVSNVSPESGDSFNEGFINAGYAIAPFTTIYAEMGFNSDDHAESVAYAIGISAEF